MRKRDTALVGFKPCPRCHGTGKIPCDGKEIYRERHRVWAEGFVGKLVAIEAYDYVKKAYRWIPGLATGVSKAQGGWPQVVVHVAISKLPSHQYWLPEPLRGMSAFFEGSYDEIKGKAYWYDLVSDPKMIRIIADTPDLLELKSKLEIAGERLNEGN
jgi:hypothetical protein